MQTWVTAAVVGAALAWLGATPARAQDSVWIHATVDTKSAPGEQVSTFRAYTSTDQPGSNRVPVTRLCVKGIGHQVQEKCEDNAAAVELVERQTGLPGLGSLCVEAVASAQTRVGPLSTNARACP